MDYSKLTVTQLTAVANAFRQIDLLMLDDLPDDFSAMLVEYMAMQDEERMAIQSEIAAKANFMAYAESLGNKDMVDALMKVADNMSKMSKYELEPIERMDVSEVEAALSKESSEPVFSDVEPIDEKQEVM